MATNVEQEMTRWVFASVSKHVNDFVASALPTTPLFIEGQHRDTSKKPDFLELRMDGPYYTELSRDYHDVYIEINILVQSGQNDRNYHRIYDSVGISVKSLEGPISVFRFGSGVNDDNSFVGCLLLEQTLKGRERIQVNHFGQIEPKASLFQSTVEAHYRMKLSR